jgi:hypothetical protein
MANFELNISFNSSGWTYLRSNASFYRIASTSYCIYRSTFLASYRVTIALQSRCDALRVLSPYDLVAILLQSCYNRQSLALQSRCDGVATGSQSPRNRIAIALRRHYNHTATALQSRYYCVTIALRLRYDCNAIDTRLQCDCDTITMLVQRIATRL